METLNEILNITLVIIIVIFVYLFIDIRKSINKKKPKKKVLNNKKDIDKEYVDINIETKEDNFYSAKLFDNLFTKNHQELSINNENKAFSKEIYAIYKLIFNQKIYLNEPFHTKFYNFLLIIDKNDFLIVDKNSRIITLNVRNIKNEEETSKAYQVFSTKEVIVSVINKSFDGLNNYNQETRQALLISIVKIAFNYSFHYDESEKDFKELIDPLLYNYEIKELVQKIINSIKDEEDYLFILDSFYFTFRNLKTYPYEISISNGLNLSKLDRTS